MKGTIKKVVKKKLQKKADIITKKELDQLIKDNMHTMKKYSTDKGVKSKKKKDETAKKAAEEVKKAIEEKEAADAAGVPGAKVDPVKVKAAAAAQEAVKAA